MQNTEHQGQQTNNAVGFSPAKPRFVTAQAQSSRPARMFVGSRGTSPQRQPAASGAADVNQAPPSPQQPQCTTPPSPVLLENSVIPSKSSPSLLTSSTSPPPNQTTTTWTSAPRGQARTPQSSNGTRSMNIGNARTSVTQSPVAASPVPTTANAAPVMANTTTPPATIPLQAIAPVNPITATKMQNTPASAPVQVTPAKVAATATTAPAQSLPANVATSPAAIQMTPAVVANKTAPVQTSPAPAQTLPAKVTTTPAPAQTLPAKVTTTPAPAAPVQVSPAIATVSASATAPVQTTPALVSTAPAPAAQAQATPSKASVTLATAPLQDKTPTSPSKHKLNIELSDDDIFGFDEEDYRKLGLSNQQHIESVADFERELNLAAGNTQSSVDIADLQDSLADLVSSIADSGVSSSNVKAKNQVKSPLKATNATSCPPQKVIVTVPLSASDGYQSVTEAAWREALNNHVKLNTAPPPSLQDVFERSKDIWGETSRCILHGLAIMWGASADVARGICSQMDDAVQGNYVPVDYDQFNRILSSYALFDQGKITSLQFARGGIEALLAVFGLPYPRVTYITNTISNSASANASSMDQSVQRAFASETAKTIQYALQNVLTPTRSVIAIQRAMRRFLFRHSLEGVKQAFSKRKCEIFRILYKAEVVFVELMRVAVTSFYIPLAENNSNFSSVLERAQMASLFNSIPKLLIGHSQFLKKLKRVLASWPKLTGLPSIALESARLMDVHVEFARNSVYIQQLLNQLMNDNRQFSDFVQHTEREVLRGEYELFALLSAPLNRLISYEQFYASLIEVMTPEDPEYAEMQRAYAFVQSSTKNMYDVVAEAPERARVLEAVARIGWFNDLLLDNSIRTFVAEYTASVTCCKRTKASQHITIFSDVLCISHERKRNEESESKSPFEVDEVHTLSRTKFVLEEVQKDQKQPNCFSLLVPIPSRGSEIITFKMASVADRTACADFFQSINMRTVPRASCSSAAINPVFGVPITELVEQNDRVEYGVPVFVEKCIVRLSQPSALECEGIFRLSGSSSRIASLRRLVEGSTTPDGWDFRPEDDNLSIASLFKSFLRELEDPLMTSALIPEYENAISSLPQGAMTRGREGEIPPIIAVVLPILSKLPRANLKTFLVLNEFLSVVASHSAENKMDPKNLSIVFAPNMFIGSGSFGDMQNFFQLCSAMIVHDKVIQEYFADLDPVKSQKSASASVSASASASASAAAETTTQITPTPAEDSVPAVVDTPQEAVQIELDSSAEMATLSTVSFTDDSDNEEQQS